MAMISIDAYFYNHKVSPQKLKDHCNGKMTYCATSSTKQGGGEIFPSRTIWFTPAGVINMNTKAMNRI